MIVVADTGPVDYLVLIGEIHLVHALYGTLLIPPAVCRELLNPATPAVVRQWAAKMPPWAEERAPKDVSRFEELGPGEREAISLALETKADFLLIDESSGRKLAVRNDVTVKGTLGVLEDADVRRVRDFDFSQALAKLRMTTIFLSESIVQDALKRYHGRQQERQQDHQRTREHDQDIER